MYFDTRNVAVVIINPELFMSIKKYFMLNKSVTVPLKSIN